MDRHPVDTQAIKDELPIEDVIGEVVALQRAGSDLVGLCPFHSERTPSFSVTPSKGLFFCHGCGAKGDIFSFRMMMKSISFPEALRELAIEAGMDVPDDPRDNRPRPSPKPRQRDDRELERRRAETQAAEQRRFDMARDIWRTALPIAGTIGETYLREARGLDLSAIGGAPATLRFAPSIQAGRINGKQDLPAMVAAVQDGAGTFIGIHRTFLKADGSGKADVEKPKLMLGNAYGGACRLGKLTKGALAISEGIETGLSVQIAMAKANRPITVWAALSLINLAGGGDREAQKRAPFHPTKKRLDPRTGESKGRVRVPTDKPDMTRPGIILPPGAREIVILGDADSDPYFTTAFVERATRRFQNDDRQVTVVWPPRGMDFNDMVKPAPDGPKDGSDQ